MWHPTCVTSLQGLWLHLFAPVLPWVGGGLCPRYPRVLMLVVPSACACTISGTEGV